MQVSILINTAREDFSLVAYPTVHLFEWTLASLRNQTQKDFEVVIADALYDKRPNYFKEHPEVFPVTHVPVKPNVWSPRGVCAISTAKNTCLLHAKGEYGVFLDDCAWVDEYFIQRTVDWIKRGNVVSSLYEVYEGEKLIYPNRSRAFTLGHSVNNLAMKMTDWEFFNGYDEMYDGAKCLVS
jgi:glycosyltransferase involved in cell wall biosynthesis